MGDNFIHCLLTQGIVVLVRGEHEGEEFVLFLHLLHLLVRGEIEMLTMLLTCSGLSTRV